jgi:hypothetical protein
MTSKQHTPRENSEEFPDAQEQAPAENLPIEHRKMSRRAFGSLFTRGAAAIGAAGILGSMPKGAEAQETPATEATLAQRRRDAEHAVRNNLDLTPFRPLPEELAIPLSEEDWKATPQDLKKEIWEGILKDYKSGELTVEKNPDGTATVTQTAPTNERNAEQESQLLNSMFGNVTLPAMQAANATVDLATNVLGKCLLGQSEGWKKIPKSAKLEELRNLQTSLQYWKFLATDMERYFTATVDRSLDWAVLGKILYDASSIGHSIAGQNGSLLNLPGAGLEAGKSAVSIGVYYGLKRMRRAGGFHAPHGLEGARDPAKLDDSKRTSAEKLLLNIQEALKRLDTQIAELEIKELGQDEYEELHDEAVTELRNNEGKKKSELNLSSKIRALVMQSTTFKNLQSSTELLPKIIDDIVSDLEAVKQQRTAP